MTKADRDTRKRTSLSRLAPWQTALPHVSYDAEADYACWNTIVFQQAFEHKAVPEGKGFVSYANDNAKDTPRMLRGKVIYKCNSGDHIG
jgi:hypothetical protein